MDTQNPEPFAKAHRAILTSSVDMDATSSRHEVQPGVQVVMASAPGQLEPTAVAYEFDASTWSYDQALEWLLTKPVYVVRVERAAD